MKNILLNMALLLLIVMINMALQSCKRDGCTDPNASNYDNKAKVDDGSCIYKNTGTTELDPPSSPTLVLPQNGATDLWPPIVFSWSPVDNADSYEIDLFFQGWGGHYASGITSTAYTWNANLSNGFKGKDVYWHVRAKNSNGLSQWSASWTFKLKL